jgi:hypothetical protein
MILSSETADSLSAKTCCWSSLQVPYWPAMPLWISIPLVAALWFSSWISGLDTTGDRLETYVIWIVTAVASVLLLLRLVRAY